MEEQYRLVSGLSEKSNECQASTLLYCLGTDSDDVLEFQMMMERNKAR